MITIRTPKGQIEYKVSRKSNSSWNWKIAQSSHNIKHCIMIYDCWLHKFQAIINFIYGAHPASPSSRWMLEYQWYPSQMIKSFSYFIDVTLCYVFYCPDSSYSFCAGNRAYSTCFFIFIRSFTQLHQSTFICWFIYGVAHTFIIFRRGYVHSWISKWQTIHQQIVVLFYFINLIKLTEHSRIFSTDDEKVWTDLLCCTSDAWNCFHPHGKFRPMIFRISNISYLYFDTSVDFRHSYLHNRALRRTGMYYGCSHRCCM